MIERTAIARSWVDGGVGIVQSITAPGDVLFTPPNAEDVFFVTLTAWNMDETSDHKVYVVPGGIPTPLRLPMLVGRLSVLSEDRIERAARLTAPALSIYADAAGVVGYQWEVYR